MKTLLLGFAFLLLFGFATAAEAVKTISATDASKLVAAGQAVLIDIREPDEWRATGVAQPALLLPMSDYDGAQKLWKPFLQKNTGKTLILYCRSGRRAALLGAKLAAEGLTVANAGGLKDWIAAGLPLAQP